MILWKYELERKQSPIISEATPHKNKTQATKWILGCVEK